MAELAPITVEQVAEILVGAGLRRNKSQPGAAAAGYGAGFEATQEDATCVRLDWYAQFPGRVRSRLEACAEALEGAGYRVNRLVDGAFHLEVVRDAPDGGDNDA